MNHPDRPDSNHEPDTIDLTDDERPVDAELRLAASDLRRHIDGPTRPFEPTTPARPMLAVAAVLVLVVGGLALLGRLGGDEAPGPDETVSADGSAAPTTSSDAGPTAAPVASPEPSQVDADAESVDLTGLVAEPAPLEREPMDRPAVGETVTDPAFATTITRLTDAGESRAIVPIATATSAWSADEAFLLLYSTGPDGGVHQLHDGADGAFLRELDIEPADIEQVYWSPLDPAGLLFIEGATLISLDVATDTRTAIHTFDGCDRVDSGIGPVAPSADASRWGLLCRSNAGDQLVSLDVVTGTEHRRAAGDAVALVPTPAGDAYVVLAADGSGQVVDPTLTEVIGEQRFGDGNIVVLTDADGDAVAVGPDFGTETPGTAVAHPLGGADSWVVVGPDTQWPAPPSGTSLATDGGDRTGRVVLSVQGQARDGDRTVLDGEIVLVDVRAEPAVTVRLAHHRSDTDDYFATPFVSLSPSGTRVVFASDWGDSGQVDTYVIDLA